MLAFSSILIWLAVVSMFLSFSSNLVGFTLVCCGGEGAICVIGIPDAERVIDEEFGVFHELNDAAGSVDTERLETVTLWLDKKRSC